MTNLQLDWCSYEAAKYAVHNWHYSETMPSGKTLKIGVWEDEQFIGVVIYSRGATANIGKPYNLDQTEVCELTRVALNEHETPVSRVLSISRKLLTDKCPGLKLVVSYADPDQNHDGSIYQADNWVYEGRMSADSYIKINGEVRHRRSCYSKFGTSSVPKLKQKLGPTNVKRLSVEGKHKYLKPLTDKMSRKIKQLSKPYP